jgi:glutathione S-transferase
MNQNQGTTTYDYALSLIRRALVPALWMLEEMGLPYDQQPFPPRVFAKEYLLLNPLGTIPLMIDGETKMTESSGICHYLGARHGPTPLIVGVDEAAYGAFLNWMYFSEATLTFPQTLGAALHPARTGRTAQSAGRDRLRQMVSGAAAGGRGRYRQCGDARCRPVHRSRYRGRLCVAARGKYRAGERFRTKRRGLLARPAPRLGA